MRPSRPQRAKRGQRGFTMVELLVTMLLLAVAMTGLAALQVHAIRQTSATKRSNEATRLGQDVLERYLIANVPGSPQAWSLENNRAGQPMSGVGADGVTAGPYTVESKIELTGISAIITVRVSWRDVDAKASVKQREVYMTTMRTP